MKPLLLLHGAIGSSNQLQPLAGKLANSYQIHLLDISGHGGNSSSADAFSIELFAADVLTYMDSKGLDKVSIFGYSMGGYVGMYLAKHHPERVERLATLATKYHWDPAIAAREIQMLNPEKIEQKLPAFAETLKQRHAPADWKAVLAKTVEMMIAMGNNNPLSSSDFAGINTPSLIMLGDRDKMVSLEETVNVYKALPAAELCILPATSHPIEQVNIDLLAFLLSRVMV